jgi:chemotaxis protein MotB
MKTNILKQITLYSLFPLATFLFCYNPSFGQLKAKIIDKTDKILTSKRYKQSIAERDNLCSKVKMLREDSLFKEQLITQKEKDIKDLLDKSEKQKKAYAELLNSSLSEAEKLHLAIKNKNNELEEKEQLLQERERKLSEMQALLNRQDSLTKALNNLVKNALLGFNSDELTIETKHGKVYVSLSDKLLFKSGSASVESKGQEALSKLAAALEKNNDIEILIEGHTDNIPIKTAVYKDNWDLSAARSISIVRILTESYHLDAKKVTAAGKSEFFPKASNDSAEGRSKNRRTEIVLSPKLEELMKLIQP